MVRANVTLYEGSQRFMSTVTELVLTSRSIDSAMLSQMCDKLPMLLQLSELYIGLNYVSYGAGVNALSSYLQTNCSLKVLHINDNLLTDMGCTAIAFALASNTTLRSLNIDGNRITVDGAVEIASVLKLESSGLAWLSMGRNALGDDGAQALASGARCSLRLRELFVHSCGIFVPGACALIEAAAASKTISECHMGSNGFSCIRELTQDNAWNACSLPQPDAPILSRLDEVYTKTLAGNVSDTVAWVRSQLTLGFGFCNCGTCEICDSRLRDAEALKSATSFLSQARYAVKHAMSEQALKMFDSSIAGYRQLLNFGGEGVRSMFATRTNVEKLLQTAVDERRQLRVKDIQQLHLQIEREKIQAVEREQELKLQKFQGL